MRKRNSRAIIIPSVNQAATEVQYQQSSVGSDRRDDYPVYNYPLYEYPVEVDGIGIIAPVLGSGVVSASEEDKQ